MKLFKLFLGIWIGIVLWAPNLIGQESAPIGSDPSIRVLLFSGTGWYRHPEIPRINGWLVRLAAEHGMEMDVSETGNDFTPERLAQYDVIFVEQCQCPSQGPFLERARGF